MLQAIRKYLKSLAFIGVMTLGAIVGALYINQQTEFFGRAGGDKANLVIDVSSEPSTADDHGLDRLLFEIDQRRASAFLDKMRGIEIDVSGEGSWVKAFGREDNEVVRVLVINYDPDMQHVETVPISFINLKSETYTLTRTDFLGKVTKIPVTAEAGSIAISQYFDANSAAIFELIPIQ